MVTNLTREFLMSNRGCYSRDEIEEKVLRGKRNIRLTTFVSDKSIPIKDRLWFFVRKCELTSIQKVEFSVRLTEIVLPIFESKNDSKKPREAILLVNKWLSGDHVSIEELNTAADAAYADAAYAGDAAYAAAYAAGDAAAYAVYAAADAAGAAGAAAAAAAGDYMDNIETFIKSFVKKNEGTPVGRRVIKLNTTGVEKWLKVGDAVKFLKNEGHKSISRQTIRNMIDSNRIESKQEYNIDLVKVFIKPLKKNI